MTLRKTTGAAMVALLAAAAARAGGPLPVGSRLELFVDDHVIGRMSGAAELRLNHPTPREVVFVTDKPWEGDTSAYFTVFRDGGIYRMYYRGSGRDAKTRKSAHGEVACYAESKDAVHWTRPELGLFEFAGSKRNNIVWDGIGTHDFTPFKDTRPDCPREARYKAFGRGKPKAPRGLYAFGSPDAIHWSLMREKAVITRGAFDSQNLAFWDAVRGEYRAYFRDFRDGRRDIRTATSKDFLHWTDPVWLAYPGAPREHLYTNQIGPYYRAPHIFLGFPARYLPARGSIVEGLLMSSRDGRSFHRWPEALIRPGLNRDKWRNRSNYIWWGLLETPSSLPGAVKEISLYVNEGYYAGGSTRIRRYTIRLDGFVSVHAPLKGGQLVTKPLRFEGKELAINFSTSAAGGIAVEVRDEAGRAVEGFALSDCPAIFGDAVEQTVRWKGGSDVSGLAGRTVRLRFVLRDADLYSFRFR